MSPDLGVGKVSGPAWGRREKVLRQLKRKLDRIIRQAAERGREGRGAMESNVEKPETTKTVKATKAAKGFKKLPKNVEVAKESMRKQMPTLPPGKSAGGTKAEKLAKAKPAAKPEKAKGPSLGREGSISHLMRSLIIARKSNEDILKAARKQFPKAGILDSWPQWYRADMLRKGFPEAKVKAP